MKADRLFRRARELSLCALTALTCVGAFAQDAEPAWIFNNGPDAARTSVGQGRVNNEFGLFNLIPQGTDLTVNVRMTEEEMFDSSARSFFGLRYKAETNQKIGGLFFTNDDELTTLSDKSFTPFAIEGDGQWHNLVVDMRSDKKGAWQGKITSFRLDPTNPSDADSRIAISRMGFFGSEDAAWAFLTAANDKPDLTLETTELNSVCRCVIPAGVVKPGFDKADYLLDPAATIATSDKTPEDRSTLVVASGNDATPLCDVSSLGFTTYSVAKPGKWALARKATPVSDADKLAQKDAVLFVLARKLMTTDSSNAFRPTAKASVADVELVKKAFAPYKDASEQGQKIDALETELAAAQKAGVTREDAAALIARGVKRILGTVVESPYSAEYFTRDRIRIGAWGNFNAADFGDEYMKTYADCGFDFILPFVSAPTNELLSLCDKYGIEATVNDSSYLDPIERSREYVDHPSFTGCYVTDEPGSDAYDKLAKDCNNYAKTLGKRAYVNLLPMYANAAQLKFGAGAAAIEYYDADPDLFRKYCASFCEKFDSDYICTDIYPLNWSGDGKKVTYPDYAESINIIASVAREYDRDFWCYIQTFAWQKGKRTPTEEEFRWQCYSMLSFGCKTILCWTYAGYNPDFPSLVDTQSRKTRAWYDARAVLHELRRLSDTFVQYRNLGAFSHNCSDKTPYLKFTNEYDQFKAIKEIDCPDPLLVGCFEGKADAKEKAFTLVNMTELEDAVGTTARLKLDATEVTAWYRGVPTEVSPNAEGQYEFYLGSGEGVFVTIK